MRCEARRRLLHNDWLTSWLEDPDYGPLLRRLTDAQAAVTVLILEGYTQAETATILGISHQAVRRRKCRAKRRLRETWAVCYASCGDASHSDGSVGITEWQHHHQGGNG